MFHPKGLRSKQKVIGSFVKMPALRVIELFGLADPDFAVADRDYAPIESTSADDVMVASACAAPIPLLIRVQSRDFVSMERR